MPFYLVTARPRPELLEDLRQRLEQDAFVKLRPFGRALTYALRNARVQPDGTAVWEEEDYCSPPLAEERPAVLDRYFECLNVRPVPARHGWREIEGLPYLFDSLHEGKGGRALSA